MKKETKSPIKDNPLRYPGQSLDEQLDDLMGNKLAMLAFLLAGSIVFPIMEWMRYYTASEPSPWAATLFFLPIFIWTIFKLVNLRNQVLALKQGRNGERAVGQYLETLRDDGHHIYHDILTNDFNIDHVIVSPKGVFTIETKTYSKPNKGRADIIFNGQSLNINGYSAGSGILNQARGQSNWLKQTVAESTGQSFPIKPVVLFPGWFIKTQGQAKSSDVWVLNPKALRKYLHNQPDTLTAEQVHLISYNLSRYIRTTTPNIPDSFLN